MLNSDGRLGNCCVEIKTHSADGKIAIARELAAKYGAICEAYLFENNPDENSIAGESISITKIITNSEYRAQILHHASTLGCARVIFVEATPTEIIRVVKVFVSSVTRQSYCELLSLISEEYLGWIYNHEDIPHFSDDVLGFCGDMHTLKLTLNLSKAAIQLFYDRDQSSIN
jgi:hypothetical protein